MCTLTPTKNILKSNKIESQITVLLIRMLPVSANESTENEQTSFPSLQSHQVSIFHGDSTIKTQRTQNANQITTK